MPAAQTIQQWLSKNVIKLGDNDCWNATGKCHNKKGWHVAFKSNGKRMLAHRAAWIASHGDIQDGLFVLHKCDNPKCCNPAHLLGRGVKKKLKATREVFRRMTFAEANQMRLAA